jgi:hypothetical protein
MYTVWAAVDAMGYDGHSLCRSEMPSMPAAELSQYPGIQGMHKQR